LNSFAGLFALDPASFCIATRNGLSVHADFEGKAGGLQLVDAEFVHFYFCAVLEDEERQQGQRQKYSDEFSSLHFPTIKLECFKDESNRSEIDQVCSIKILNWTLVGARRKLVSIEDVKKPAESGRAHTNLVGLG
jgi:hypothetical protein